MRNSGFVRVRRMQPRYKYKHHSPLRAAAIPTPRNILFLITFVVTAVFLSNRLGFFASPDLSSPSQSSPGQSSTTYQHGAVGVDRVIWYEGNSLLNRSDHATHNAQQRSHTESLPHHVQIQVAPLDPNQLPSQDQKPDRAPIRNPSDSHHDTAHLPQSEHTQQGQQIRQEQQQQHQPEKPQSPIAVQPKSLKEILKFTPATAVNFMHFHKTGGVSFKTSLHAFYHEKYKGNGQRVTVRDACYTRQGVKDDPAQPTFILWRCDWEPLREMTEEERNKHDFVFGHQFWGNGAGTLLNKRDLRSFTILRHPFDRKVSFYYHFFVREVGRKEEDVTFEDIKNFLLYDKLTIKANLGRDLGPNYMAGRLLSDGRRGFVGNTSYGHYEVAQENKLKVAEEAKKLLRGYVFVGLQKESNAAKCMLRKVVETFNEVNGVSNDGVERIDEEAAVLNRGSYSMSAEDIWKRFTEEQKVIFDRKERVDLLIYEEGERLFRTHVKLLGCADRVRDPKYK